MCICVYVYMSIRAYVYMCMCICAFVYMRICVYVYMCVCVYVYRSICACAYMCLCVYVYMRFVYMCICAYVFICMCFCGYMCQVSDPSPPHQGIYINNRMLNWGRGAPKAVGPWGPWILPQKYLVFDPATKHFVNVLVLELSQNIYCCRIHY